MRFWSSDMNLAFMCELLTAKIRFIYVPEITEIGLTSDDTDKIIAENIKDTKGRPESLPLRLEFISLPS